MQKKIHITTKLSMDYKLKAHKSKRIKHTLISPENGSIFQKERKFIKELYGILTNYFRTVKSDILKELVAK